MAKDRRCINHLNQPTNQHANPHPVQFTLGVQHGCYTHQIWGRADLITVVISRFYLLSFLFLLLPNFLVVDITILVFLFF